MATTREIKKKVRQLIERDKFETLKGMLDESQRVLSALFSMTYDKESPLAWKAIKAYGRLLVALAERSPSEAGEHVRRLLWSITEESGGLGWAAIEIIAEIVCNAHGKMDNLIPLIPQFADESPFVPSVLYALRRLTECLGRLPWEEDEVREIIQKAESMDNPTVNGYLIVAYAKIKGFMDLRPLKEGVLGDERPCVVFDGETLLRTTPKTLAKKLNLNE